MQTSPNMENNNDSHQNPPNSDLVMFSDPQNICIIFSSHCFYTWVLRGYRHPNSEIKSFGDAFVNVIKSFKANKNYIALGDYNINYDRVVSSQNISNYFNHLCSVGCLQLINKPTRVSKTSSSIIDYVYTKSSHAAFTHTGLTIRYRTKSL